MVHVVLTPKPFVLAFLLAVPLLALDRTPKSLTWFIQSGAAAMFRSSRVMDLSLTKDGRLWVATDQALFCFDGSPSLASNEATL
jgi:hypothetical protein